MQTVQLITVIAQSDYRRGHSTAETGGVSLYHLVKHNPNAYLVAGQTLSASQKMEIKAQYPHIDFSLEVAETELAEFNRKPTLVFAELKQMQISDPVQKPKVVPAPEPDGGQLPITAEMWNDVAWPEIQKAAAAAGIAKGTKEEMVAKLVEAQIPLPA